MKILKIEFENINSLKGKHEINFEKAPFTGSALFAITGPTGSGKSSILDVISLALFNMVPRLGKISKNDIISKGALLTRNQKEAFAKVTYAAKSGVFASEWRISTNRNNNLRDYEMFLFDLTTKKPLDYKKSDIPSKNEELIGLNYNQFIKSVLLAQGDFAQFLKARKDERGELLEKITGTGIYRQVGIKAFQKFKAVNAEIEDQQREINLLQKDLLEEEALRELNSALETKTAACGPLEKAIEGLDRQILLKKNIEEQINQVQAQEKLKQAAQEKLEAFEKDFGEDLQKHEQVQFFAEDLRAWQILDEACKGLNEDLTRQENHKKENLQAMNSCLEKIYRFLKQEPGTESIEESLQEFSRKVRKLQQQRDEKLSAYRHLQEKFHSEVRELSFRLNGNLEKDEEKLRELAASGEEALKELEGKLKDIDLHQPEEEKNRLRQVVQLGRRAQQKWLSMEQLAAELPNCKQEIQALLPEVEKLPQKIELDSSRAAVLKERLKNLQLQRELEVLKASFEKQRHQLITGEPCPLCGSKEHPYATDLPPVNNELQVEILSVQEELQSLEKEITKKKTTLAHHNSRLTELQKQVKEKEDSLRLQKGHFQKEFSNLNPSEENWESFCESREEKMQVLEAYEKEKRKLHAIHAGLPLIKELKEVTLKGREIKEELDAHYSGQDIETDCLELQNLWRGLEHKKITLLQQTDELQKKLETRSTDLKTAEASLAPKIAAVDCNEIHEALQRLMPERVYSERRKQREEFTSQKEQIEASIKTLNAQLQVLKERDVDENIEQLSTRLKEKRDQLKQRFEECEELRRKQRNDTERRSRIAAIERELEGAKTKIRRWELLNHLIGDAKGKKFNDFAQDLSLSQLLVLANRRLKDLSDRYRIDKPEEAEDDSLVAIDEHMGGQRRSVKTLSGGETFLLSLSMALALSDLASRNVEINSLFIDEGFGTLDPETLDQTLDTLERLQAESSKTIGIISHVDSLKERIATQIKLTRNGQGYSSLEITG
ncbi:SbcC/MukB-like Walker B domain-containing protein [Salinimicrobium oceani]|uniref:Exonuclease SbcC n=1 Tax=Salinimicrobium oceani TaxID=2722702 RepID=A0ABX1CW51_9FLAO|nr:SbcC/MukB-like Walker B domain-containing protein [Salinimicrobium oceani]NJW52520.1 hypothetical protein [Salinimicrobium oceani]